MAPFDSSDRTEAITVTFADAIRRLDADPSLAQGRRRDLVSGLRSAARLMGLPPEAIPCDPAFLRPRLMALHPVQAGIGEGRLANIRSAVRAVLSRMGLAGCGRDPDPLGPAWADLLGTIQDRWLPIRLARFARFCDARRIAPGAVTVATIEAFRAEAERTTIGGSIRATVGKLVQAWNRAAATVPGWPAPAVTLVSRSRKYGLPLAAFPPSFPVDVEAWVALVDGSRLFEDEGPVRPLRPGTIRSQRSRIRLAASALVRSGRPVETVRTLADLVEPEAAKAILRFHLDRAGGRPTGFVHGMASLLLAIARHHANLDAVAIKALQRLVAKTRPKAEGLTATNRKYLAQFDDERNVARLLHLPAGLMTRAEGAGKPAEAARLALFAVAIEMLLHFPIRLGNLVGLDLDRHLLRTGHGRRATVMLRIAGGEVKNREPIEFLLPPDLVRMIDRYVARFRPAFARSASAWLFPNPKGGMRAQQGFGRALSELVWKETGLRLSAHTFRHIGAKLYLEARPGDYETVRRVLGHASIDTTTGFYTGLETVRAGRRFDETILGLRRGTALLARTDRRGRR